MMYKEVKPRTKTETALMSRLRSYRFRILCGIPATHYFRSRARPHEPFTGKLYACVNNVYLAEFFGLGTRLAKYAHHSIACLLLSWIFENVLNLSEHPGRFEKMHPLQPSLPFLFPSVHLHNTFGVTWPLITAY